MKKNKKPTVSLVELICAIVILSLLIIMAIVAVYKEEEKSKEDSKLAQEESIIKACERYILKNSNDAPKVIGDSVKIKLDTLKERRHLLEDIYNSKKENCMENSYVRVYKLNQSEYSYLPYLYCGDEEIPEVEEIPEPDTKILFIDGKNENSNSLIFNSIHESRIYIEIEGGEDSFGRQIEIDNYEINIYMKTKTNPDLVKSYSSGIIDANRKHIYTIDKKIMSYVNANDATSISVVVRATNVLGGVSEVTSIAQANE